MTNDELLEMKTYYISEMSESGSRTWGGEYELKKLADLFNTRIIIEKDGNLVTYGIEDEDNTNEPIHLKLDSNHYYFKIDS